MGRAKYQAFFRKGPKQKEPGLTRFLSFEDGLSFKRLFGCWPILNKNFLLQRIMSGGEITFAASNSGYFTGVNFRQPGGISKNSNLVFIAKVIIVDFSDFVNIIFFLKQKDLHRPQQCKSFRLKLVRRLGRPFG